jgi:transcription factor IIIB subunit 2
LLNGYVAKGNPEPPKPKKVRISLVAKFSSLYFPSIFSMSFHLQRRKTNESSAPRDTANPAGNTAADSVRNMLNKNPKYSKRINYDALRHLLVEGPNLDDKDDDQLYTMDDKSDGEGMGMLLIEEAPGTVVSAPPPKPKPKKVTGVAARVLVAGNAEADGDEDMDAEEGSDKGEDVGWEEAYEQEV